MSRIPNRSQYVTPPSIPAQRTARTPQPGLASPEPASVVAMPTVAEPPAVRLLTQAHEWSTSAKSENDFTRIIETCRKAQAAQPDQAVTRYATALSSWALNRRGQMRADAGRNEEALADFDAAIKADPKRWRAIHNRGVLGAQAGEFASAFDDFTRTIELNPKFAKAYSNRAALFVVSGNVQPAVQDYTRAIDLDPELSVAHRGLGRARHLLGQLDEAVCHYDEAIRLSPNDAYAIASRADVLTDLGQYAEASAQYERAIEVDPDSTQANSGSAWLLATCPDDAVRNPKIALERAQMAIRLTAANDAASLDTLAAAQACAGDFASAKQTVEKAVHLASDEEKQVFQARLALYEQQKPYRIAPVKVAQAKHQERTK
jgi:tetratricopeptide (TPR) repeat protein